MKLAPMSLRSLAGALETEMQPWYKKFSNGFCSLVGGYICQHMLCEVVLEYQGISDSRWLVWLQSGLYAGEVNM